MFFIIEKSEESFFEFKQNDAIVVLILTMYKNGSSKNSKFIK